DVPRPLLRRLPRRGAERRHHHDVDGGAVIAALDADRWTGPPATEGSPERVEACRRLWSMARRAARMLELPAAEWVAGVRRDAPQLVAASGDDVEHVAAYAWGG